MRIVLAVVMMFVAVVVHADLYTKVDDNTVAVTMQVERTENYTLDKLDFEIQGCDNDLLLIDKQAEALKAGILARKAKLEQAKIEADVLGIKKVEANLISEPVE